VYVVGVNGRFCVLMDEMGCFELLSFYVDIDIMQVCVFGADELVSPCLGGLSENKNLLRGSSCVCLFFCSFLCVLTLFGVLICRSLFLS
jgi:hypothetical protein